jgi:hypothetical protein
MSDLVQVLISVLVVTTITLFISKHFKISKRYERQSRSRSTMNSSPIDSWSALDHGIDPSDVQSDYEKP